jgi:hypothetical protein
VNTQPEKTYRFYMDRRTELRQRIASHLALQTPAGLQRPTWKDTLTPDEIHKLMRKIRPL